MSEGKNRALKTKLWCHDKNEWEKDEYVIFPNGQVAWLRSLSPIDMRKHTLVQFTGLHDKNGKEIYEGDILRVANGSINCSIMFNTYEVKKLVRGYYMPYFLYDDEGNYANTNFSHWCEIIGNVFENSELLKEVEK